jgi:hypothetical protein
MRKGIFYYSKTGKNKILVDMLNQKGNFEIEEIIDKKNRKGIIGFVKSGFDAITKKLTEIENIKLNPDVFDHIIIGTPIWAGNITPAIRTFLKKFNGSIKNYSVISVSGFGEKNLKVINDFVKILGSKPKSVLFVSENELKEKIIEEKINKFLSEI